MDEADHALRAAFEEVFGPTVSVAAPALEPTRAVVA
jgi:hypothetical protein